MDGGMRFTLNVSDGFKLDTKQRFKENNHSLDKILLR